MHYSHNPAYDIELNKPIKPIIAKRIANNGVSRHSNARYQDIIIPQRASIGDLK